MGRRAKLELSESVISLTLSFHFPLEVSSIEQEALGLTVEPEICDCLACQVAETAQSRKRRCQEDWGCGGSGAPETWSG